ncbi:DUF2185 domain-containing protein [Tenacibaculum jejuense]|uniref:Immunity protein Imm33 domain-containing protein n=1 Tax=Tenacibaculum jejuense TaxID=584609 RepID=A0A238U4Q1_9FLAO|nr:DUF2185 domain-containing protein [Tenacibaculum jejuense]SNR14173.1 conserved protein of unknown function [Tenacibaculum jejuense]
MRIFSRKKKKEENFDDFPSIGGLMVSKMVSEEEKKPLFMYREKRTRPEDSGWRIFSGYESQDYTNTPNNVGIYNPSTILKIDSSIKELLLKGVGSVFERENDKSSWYEVDDYELEDDYLTKHRLTENWILEINNLFERIKEESGDLLYTTGDKSLRIAIWDERGKNRQQIFEEHQQQINNRDESNAKTLDTFDFSDDFVKRIGYEIQEQDENKKYNVIYAFSLIDEEILQMAFYFDNEKDKSWAIETWKKIKTE